jgi:hypothetical protein
MIEAILPFLMVLVVVATWLTLDWMHRPSLEEVEELGAELVDAEADQLWKLLRQREDDLCKCIDTAYYKAFPEERPYWKPVGGLAIPTRRLCDPSPVEVLHRLSAAGYRPAHGQTSPPLPTGIATIGGQQQVVFEDRQSMDIESYAAAAGIVLP